MSQNPLPSHCGVSFKFVKIKDKKYIYSIYNNIWSDTIPQSVHDSQKDNNNRRGIWSRNLHITLHDAVGVVQ